MAMLAPLLGFITFLLVLPARVDQLGIDVYAGPGGSGTHCFTHLGGQNALGPLSCSRWGAAGANVIVTLGFLLLSRWRDRRKAVAPARG